MHILANALLKGMGWTGCVVPEAPVTRISFEEEIQADIRQRLGNSKSGMTSDELDVKEQASIANALRPLMAIP